LYVIWEKQDQIWAKIVCIPKLGAPVHLWGRQWYRGSPKGLH